MLYWRVDAVPAIKVQEIGRLQSWLCNYAWILTTMGPICCVDQKRMAEVDVPRRPGGERNLRGFRGPQLFGNSKERKARLARASQNTWNSQVGADPDSRWYVQVTNLRKEIEHKKGSALRLEVQEKVLSYLIAAIDVPPGILWVRFTGEANRKGPES